MTAKTILQILQAFHQPGFVVEIDGSEIEWWEDSEYSHGAVRIRLVDDDPIDPYIYMQTDAMMVAETKSMKLFRYSNCDNMNHTRLCDVKVFTRTPVEL